MPEIPKQTGPKAAKPIYFFRILAGTHCEGVQKEGAPEGQMESLKYYHGRVRGQGDVFQSSSDLVKLHGAKKFQRLTKGEYDAALAEQEAREEALAPA